MKTIRWSGTGKLRILVFLILTVMPSLSALTQDSAPPGGLYKPNAGAGAYNYLYRAGLICAAGASQSSVAVKPTGQCGASFTLFPPYFELEAGVMGPQAHRSNVSGYLSTNGVVPIGHLGNKFGAPLLVGGYTWMWQTGHAVDYGVAFEHPSTHTTPFNLKSATTGPSPLPISTT